MNQKFAPVWQDLSLPKSEDVAEFEVFLRMEVVIWFASQLDIVGSNYSRRAAEEFVFLWPAWSALVWRRKFLVLGPGNRIEPSFRLALISPMFDSRMASTCTCMHKHSHGDCCSRRLSVFQVLFCGQFGRFNSV